MRTYYEVVVSNYVDGSFDEGARRYRLPLWVYAKGRKHIIEAYRTRPEAVRGLTGCDDFEWNTKTQRFESQKNGGWWIGYSGRTQRDADATGHLEILPKELQATF